METSIIEIGNSKGLILPATLLRQLGLEKGSWVNLEKKNGSIIITPGKRAEWAQAAEDMNRRKEDSIIGKMTKEYQEELPWQ